MPLPDDLIATVDDVAVRIGRTLTAEESARVTALLGDASSMVRAITGRPFGTGQFTTRRKLVDGRIVLAQSDIVSVDAAATIGAVDVDVIWDGLHTISAGTITQFDSDLVVDVLDITFTRSGDLAPQWVVAIVAQTAARAFGRPADQTGVTQESIAGYSYSVGSAASRGGVGLLADDVAALRRAYPPLPAVAWMSVR